MVSPRALALAALVVGAVALVLVAGQPFSGNSSHQLRAQFASAEQLAPGLEVRIAGRKVGSIGDVSWSAAAPW